MKLQRRPRQQPLVPLASMGDIAFLLIIFFVLTTVFVQEANIESEPPASADIERILKPSQASVIMDEDGMLYLNGEKIAVESLESYVTTMLEKKKDRIVMVKIHKELTADVFRPVLMALSKADANMDMIGDLKKVDK